MHPKDIPLLDIEGNPNDHRIVVAMSGGVDSSVVAAILAYQGYDVVGVTLQLYDHGEAIQKKGACCAGQDIYDAKNVADKIGFPHFVLDYESKFKENVIDHFIDSYLSGSTPIPCVQCNMDVKFSDLLKFAKDMNSSAMATGHYIQRKKTDDMVSLYRGIDHNKDQSYFLYGTTQEQINFVHFPLGGVTKDQTRNLAEFFGLSISNKPDSQDICFVPEGKYSDVIKKYRPSSSKVGDIFHIDGTYLGKHRGVIHYTVGQRRGLGLDGGTKDPLFVIKIDAENNIIYVGNDKDLKKNYVYIDNINWLGSKDIPKDGKEIYVKLRSMLPPKKAILYPCKDDKTSIFIPEGEKSISPGQAAVFYGKEDQLLGGGRIFASGDRLYS